MPIDWFPLWLSLRVAALSTLFSLLVGLWLAYLLANREFRGREAVDAVATLPLVLPPTVLGYYLLVVLGREGPIGRVWESVFGPPGIHLAGCRGRRNRPCVSPARENGSRRAGIGRPQLRESRPHAGCFRVERLLARHTPPRPPLHLRRRRARLRALPGRLRRHPH